MGGLTSLTRLVLRTGAVLAFDAAAAMPRLRSLRTLELSCRSMDSRLLAGFAQLTRLTSLRFTASAVLPDALMLPAMPQLKDL